MLEFLGTQTLLEVPLFFNVEPFMEKNYLASVQHIREKGINLAIVPIFFFFLAGEGGGGVIKCVYEPLNLETNSERLRMLGYWN